MKQWLLIITILLLTACGGKQEKNASEKDLMADSSADSSCIAGIEEDSVDTGRTDETPGNLPWVDSVIKYYIDNTKSADIRNAGEKNLGVAWMFGDIEMRDGMSLITCQVGRNGDDRFETYQWLYIDTVTRTIYEYDIADDAIHKWTAN